VKERSHTGQVVLYTFQLHIHSKQKVWEQQLSLPSFPLGFSSQISQMLDFFRESSLFVDD